MPCLESRLDAYLSHKILDILCVTLIATMSVLFDHDVAALQRIFDARLVLRLKFSDLHHKLHMSSGSNCWESQTSLLYWYIIFRVRMVKSRISSKYFFHLFYYWKNIYYYPMTYAKNSEPTSCKTFWASSLLFIVITAKSTNNKSCRVLCWRTSSVAAASFDFGWYYIIIYNYHIII